MALVGGISNSGGSKSRCNAGVVEHMPLAARRRVAAFQQDRAVGDVYVEQVHLCAHSQRLSHETAASFNQASKFGMRYLTFL